MTPIIICCIAIALVLLTGYGTLKASYIDKKEKPMKNGKRLQHMGTKSTKRLAINITK